MLGMAPDMLPPIKTLDGDDLRRHVAELVERTRWSRKSLRDFQRDRLKRRFNTLPLPLPITNGPLASLLPAMRRSKSSPF